MPLRARDSLRARVTGLIAGLLLLVVVGLVSVAWREARNSATVVAASRLTSVVEQIASLLNASARQGTEALSEVAGHAETLAFLSDPTPDARERARARLAADAMPTDLVSTVELVDPAGRRLLAAGDTTFRRAEAALAGLDDSITVGAFLLRGDTIEYPVVAPVGDSSQPLGHLVQWRIIQASGDERGALQDLIGTGAELYVGNRDGSVWTDLVGVAEGPAARVLDGPTEYAAPDGGTRLGMARPVGGTGWQVVVELSQDEVLAPVRAFLFRMSGLGALFLLFGTAGAWAAAGRVSAPISRLTEAVQAVSRGDYDTNVANERQDEIGVLSRGFDEMARRVEEGRRDLEAKVARRTADLSSALTQLRQSERLLFQFLEALPIGIFVVNPDGGLHYTNEASRTILGRRTPRDSGAPVLPELYRSHDDGSEEPYPADERPLARALGGESAHVDDAAIRRGEELVPIEVWAVPVYGAEDEIRYAVAAFNDVTDRRAAEVEVRRARRLAEMSNRAKSDFLAKMSHELRTPLNSIIGFSEILLDETFGSLNDKQRRHVDNVHASGRQLLRLINEVLDLSKVEAGRMELTVESVRVTGIVREVNAMLGALAAQKSIELSHDIPDELTPLRADPVRLKQILVNLVGNAIKFTPEGGRVRVGAREAPDERGEAAGIEISVADTGIGIDAADQARIFDEFEQVKGTTAFSESGTGLGLSLTKRFVELHGGSIRLESEVGVGSTFTVWLPRHPASEHGASAPATDPQAPVAAEDADAVEDGPLVLVVEDEDRAAEIITHHLEGAGYRTSRARTSDEAVTLARTLQPDAITLDIFLPDGNGNQVLALLKKGPETSTIPIVVVSISSDRELGMALGAKEWIVKPVSRDDLVSAIGRVTDLGPPGAVRRVLVVDDDPSVRELLTDLLESRGFDVLVAAGGREGIELAMRESPDLVLLDLLMPGVSGFQVIRELKATGKRDQMQIVVFTEKDLTPAEAELLRQDVEGIVAKCDGRRALLQELGRVAPTGTETQR